MSDFPAARFVEADATPAEVEQLRSEFVGSDLTIQRSLTDAWTERSTGGLRDLLAALRGEGHFAVRGSETAPDVDSAVVTAEGASILDGEDAGPADVPNGPDTDSETE